MTTNDPRIARAEQIAKALTGLHTSPGTYGHWLISTNVWAKGAKVRVYLEKRFVDLAGNIDRRVDGNGYIDILTSSDLAYAVKLDGNEIRRAVEAL